MSPYMRAYEAGINLAQTEFFDKVAAPPGAKPIGGNAGPTTKVTAPKVKAPTTKAAPTKAPATGGNATAIKPFKQQPRKPSGPRAVKEIGSGKTRVAQRPAPLKSSNPAQRPAPKPAPKSARTPATNQTPAPASKSILDVGRSAQSNEGRKFQNQAIGMVTSRELNPNRVFTPEELSTLRSGARLQNPRLSELANTMLTQAKNNQERADKKQQRSQSLQEQQTAMAANIQDPKVRKLVEQSLSRANQKPQSGSAQATTTPAPQSSINNSDNSLRSQFDGAGTMISNAAGNAQNYLSNLFSSDSQSSPQEIPTNQEQRALMSLPRDPDGTSMSTEPNSTQPQSSAPSSGDYSGMFDSLTRGMSNAYSGMSDAGDKLVEGVGNAFSSMRDTASKAYDSAVSSLSSAETPQNNSQVPSFSNLSTTVPSATGTTTTPSPLGLPTNNPTRPSPLQLPYNVLGRVGDVATGAQNLFNSPELLRNFEDQEYGTSSAMDGAEFDSMNNAAMDADNQETAAKLEETPGTAEYDARIEREEQEALDNRFDVQSGGYGKQLSRFRNQFGQDEKTKELLEGINYKDFASALGNRGLRVGDQMDARQIIERLRQQQGAEGPVDTDNLGAIGIRDSRGRDANRGALGRGRRAAQPRQNTVQRPNTTNESPVLPSGTSDLTPRERANLYGELDSLYEGRNRIVRENGGRPLSDEQRAEVSKMNKAIQGYAGMDEQLLPMYNREGGRVRNMNLDPRMLRGRTTPRTGPRAADLIAKLRQQGR